MDRNLATTTIFPEAGIAQRPVESEEEEASRARCAWLLDPQTIPFAGLFVPLLHMFERGTKEALKLFRVNVCALVRL